MIKIIKYYAKILMQFYLITYHLNPLFYVLWRAMSCHVFSRLARQIQARKTVLKQKSRSSTSKFWMKYNFIFVHAKFQDMFRTQEKSYASKCNFSALRFPTKLCCCIMASNVLPCIFTSGTSNSGEKNCFETKKPVFYQQILGVV